jgi:hypothetical protein
MDKNERATGKTSTPRIGKWLLPAFAGLILAGGIAAVLVAFNVGGIRGDAKPGPGTRNEPAAIVTPAPKLPLSPEARRVAGRFILTAVARKHLDEAYSLVAPSLKQGMTLAQWETGNIPVVPYPTNNLKPVRMALESSDGKEASVRVFLDPKSGSDVKPQIFILQIAKFGTRWLVTTWVPYNAIAIPRGGGD